VLGEALSSDLVVANPHYRAISQFVYGFVRSHNSLPKHGDVELWTTGLPDTQRNAVLEALSRLATQDTRDFTPQYLATTVVEELRQVAAKTAVSRLASATQATPDMLYTLSEAVKKIEPITITGLANIRDVERWVMADEQEEMIPSGIPKLDDYTGGFMKGELVIEFADSGLGKTTLLCNHGHAGALHGHNILHVTLELNARRTLHRYYRRIAEADRVNFRTNQVEVIRRSKHWLQYAKGNIHVLEQRAYELDAETLRIIVDRYVQMHGQLDMLILDYIDLLAPSKDLRGKSTSDQIAQMSHRLRGIGLDFNLVALTASQSVRKASGAERLTMSDMSDSYGKVRAAGLLIGYVQTDQEAKMNQGRLCLLKLRDAPGRGNEVPVYVNHDLMRISDLDHADTVRVMRQLGHLPTGIPGVTTP
jgi:KaiC/GvpD/RAD55 family RecA-like ATPase